MKYDWIAIIGLLVLVGAAVTMLPASASETVNVGNYSFTLNMTVLHEIVFNPPDKLPMATISTFDGKVFIADWSGTGLEQLDEPTDYVLLGTEQKPIGNEGIKTAKIYKTTKTYASDDVYMFDLPPFKISSRMNLTQSIDFFKDVKIARIKKLRVE